MPAATIAISSQSKRKLRAYEFQPGAGQPAPVDKSTTEHMVARTVDDAASEQIQNEDPTYEGSRPFPNTPGNRIAFADLIANPEDALGRFITSTPGAHVEWRHVPGSSETRRTSGSYQRGHKRAHSSSPASSSQVERSKHLRSDKEPLDLESITRSLRTPKQDDPVLALWDRYADTHDRKDRSDIALPLLPPLSSSPHTPNTAHKNELLRRTASCGIEWPTSATKRRKIVDRDPHNRTKGIFAMNKAAILGKDQPKHSRVSMLVDSIQQTLAQKQAPEVVGPSSSSPVPEGHHNVVFSAPQQIGPPPKLARTREDDQTEEEQDREMYDKSSEFGDMDFDMDDPDLLRVLQTAGTQANSGPAHKRQIAQPIQKQQHGNGNISSSRSQGSAVLSNRQDGLHAMLVNPQISDDTNRAVINRQRNQQTTSIQSSDDFDDNDDAFTNELEELAKKIDSQDPMSVASAAKSRILQQANAQLSRQCRAPDGFDDIFDDADNDDYDNDDLWREVDKTTALSAIQSAGATSEKHNNQKSIKRYLVIDIMENMFELRPGQKRPEKILSIKDEKSQQRYVIVLRQSWYDTRCSKDSYIHLIGDFDHQGKCIVDDKDNMVILHPDHLVSATVVADSFSCVRRATLQDRVKATNPPEAPQVYGHLIHEVFGEALRQNVWTLDNLKRITEILVPNYIESLYEIGVQPADATEYVMSKMPELIAWARIFISDDIVPDAQLRDRNGATISASINKLLELEEHIWSPMYGLKGNVDATVQARMHLPSDTQPRTLTVPLELKTGKRDSNEMHRAQTALYTLLLSDRYDITVTSGILYYLETSKTFRVEGIRNEIRHMIIQRNELACYVHDKLALPPMIRKEHLCKKCYAQTSCFAYHKLVENGDADSSGMKQTFVDVVGHLGPTHQEFFKKWDDLLTKEERDSMKFRRELWTMISTERESLGRCFANVVIEPGSAIENIDSPKINRYTYSFVKHDDTTKFSFAESQITVGEPIVISDENGHFALANGYVTSIRPSRIVVAVDRRLSNIRQKQPGYHPTNNQTFSGIMSVCKDTTVASSVKDGQPTLYRIDKDEFANGMATARNNLLRIMEKDLFRARELRQLIVNNRAPVFKTSSTAYTLTGPASQQSINTDQRHAIEKVMSARDYALVLGMPGTGKTTTIAHIIRALVLQGKSVLLTSYTHTAVDNILLKIKDDNIPILRLGAIGKIHPEVQQFADLAGIPKKTIAELEHSWSHSKVVATTCLGINHAIFNHRKFDYCIVDEASQITLPVCLGPIRLASTFILVGDHYQLPPLVQNKDAQQGGLDISLFKLLSDMQPSSVVNLEHQYRMAEDVMTFSNRLVYDGRLKCGNSAVAERTLHIPNLKTGLEAHHHSASSVTTSSHSKKACILARTEQCWLQSAMLPENRCVFLNTDTMSDQPGGLGAPETVSGSGTRITNSIEAVLIAQILTVLIRAGVSPKAIGVITFYRSQLALLRATVKTIAGSSAAADVEMHTADKYQGRDKEVILLSCVRSNSSCHVGELLKDWRRVNVALTRARSKLIILGSSSTLGASGVPVLEGMIKIANERSWIHSLPIDAAQSHLFENRGTQTQTQTKQQVGDRTSQQRMGDTKVGMGQDTRPSTNHKRLPLADADINTAGRLNIRKTKSPTKVVRGVVDVEKLLDKNPIMRNIADELLDLVDIM